MQAPTLIVPPGLHQYVQAGAETEPAVASSEPLAALPEQPLRGGAQSPRGADAQACVHIKHCLSSATAAVQAVLEAVQHLAHESRPAEAQAKPVAPQLLDARRIVSKALTSLVCLTLREHAVFQQRLAADAALCRRLRRQAIDSHNLRRLAAHLRAETRGQVVLQRLDPSTSDYARCSAAVVDNVRPGTLDGVPFASATRVLDVYRLTNAFTGSRFNRRGAGAGKVLGLFVSVSSTALPRLIAYGAHPPPPPSAGLWDAKAAFVKAVREREVAAGRRVASPAGSTLGSFAHDTVQAASTLPIPLALSRRSVAPADVAWLQSGGAVCEASVGLGVDNEVTLSHILDAPPVRAVLGAGSEAPGHASLLQAQADAVQAAAGTSSALRYICLCRVDTEGAVPAAQYDAQCPTGSQPTRADGVPAWLVAAHTEAHRGEAIVPPLHHPPTEQWLVFDPSAVQVDFVMQVMFTDSAPAAAQPHASVELDSASGKNAPGTHALHTCCAPQTPAEEALKWSALRAIARQRRERVVQGALDELLAGPVAALAPTVASGLRHATPEWAAAAAQVAVHIGSQAGAIVRDRVASGQDPTAALIAPIPGIPAPELGRFVTSATRTARGPRVAESEHGPAAQGPAHTHSTPRPRSHGTSPAGGQGLPSASMRLEGGNAVRASRAARVSGRSRQRLTRVRSAGTHG